MIFSKEWTHLEEEDHGPGADAAHALAEVVTTIGHVSISSPPPSPPSSSTPSSPAAWQTHDYNYLNKIQLAADENKRRRS